MSKKLNVVGQTTSENVDAINNNTIDSVTLDVVAEPAKKINYVKIALWSFAALGIGAAGYFLLRGNGAAAVAEVAIDTVTA